MKRIRLFMVLCAVVGFSANMLGTNVLMPTNFRWRNDDGNETTATWKADLNQNVSVTNNDNIRLRVMFQAPQGATNCPLALTYYTKDDATLVSVSGDEQAGDFAYGASTQVSDMEPTTQNITLGVPSGFVPGYVIGGSIPDVTLNSSSFTEMEFCIKPTSTVKMNKAYFFSFVTTNNSVFPSMMPVSLFYGTDTEKPVISGVPSDMTVYTASESETGAVANWTQPSATDNWKVEVLSSNFGPGTTFPLGETVVTYSATDPAGNVGTASFKVTVLKPLATGIDKNVAAALEVTPNPVVDRLSVNVGNVPTLVSILDITGKVVASQTVTSNETINVGTLPKGCYLLEAKGTVCKFVKK